MKWKCYILLFGVLVFLGETVSIPYQAKADIDSRSCSMYMAMHAEGKKNCCKKHADKKTQKPMNCVDCPLCCITITPSFFLKPVPFLEPGKIEYRPFKNPLLSSYHDETWKPPDAFPFSVA